MAKAKTKDRKFTSPEVFTDEQQAEAEAGGSHLLTEEEKDEVEAGGDTGEEVKYSKEGEIEE